MKYNQEFETTNNLQDQSYLHSFTARALGPLVQAIITGGLIGISVFILALWQKWPDAGYIALFTWLSVTTVTWLILQRHWFSLTKLEVMTGWDIDQDGTIGEPEPRHSVTVDVHTKTPGGFDHTAYVTLPFSEADINTLAAGLNRGQPFTEREWCGSGKPLSVNQFRKARAEMLQRGLIELTNPKDARQGYRLTRAGLAVMRHFSPTPSMQ